MSDSLADTEPLRVMALHALLYCPRLFYLEEVEEIRVADAAVYAGRELHSSLEAAEGEAWVSFEVNSYTLGLFGKLDTLKRRDGHYIPYEHKRGRCRREADNTPGAWPSDAVQVTAYTMMLEEHLGEPIPEARIHYHTDNVTVRINLNEDSRKEVFAAIRLASQLRDSVNRPPITDNENLCRRCSLAPVCLPEEVRQETDPNHEPLQLFPANDQRMSLHVISQGATIGRSADRLVVRPREGPESQHPSHEVGSVLLHGFNQISTQALRLCVDRDISVHWLSRGGDHLASLTATAGQVQRRIRQYQALNDEGIRLSLSRKLALGKVAAQHRYLLRATRVAEQARESIRPNLNIIAHCMQAIAHAGSVEALRGNEGEAAARYFASINVLISPDIPETLHFTARSRRPTLDRFSCILNFGYALLKTAVMRAVLATGLEPAFGFYHTPRSAAYPLVLDLMELFRVTIWDIPVIGALNRSQWDPSKDFSVTKTRVWLSDEGKTKAVGLFEERLAETWRHPVVNYSLSYARTIELEARLLEKEWSGEPGLFARSRLR